MLCVVRVFDPTNSRELHGCLLIKWLLFVIYEKEASLFSLSLSLTAVGSSQVLLAGGEVFFLGALIFAPANDWFSSI